MRIEHVALNVDDPPAVAEWYCQHLGMTIARQMDAPPYTHFLTDCSGNVMLEIYRNPPDNVPDYASMDPLLLHLAFVSEDPVADTNTLVSAGATVVEHIHLDDGSHLAMLRDPWGLAIQLCQRGTPFAQN